VKGRRDASELEAAVRFVGHFDIDVKHALCSTLIIAVLPQRSSLDSSWELNGRLL